MKKKNIIVVIACCLMLVAFFVLPYGSGIKEGDEIVKADKGNTLFALLKGVKTTTSFLLSLLVLLAPFYVLIAAFRRNLKMVEKLVIPEKAAMLLPLIMFVILWVYIWSLLKENDISLEHGSGFYLYLVSAIIVAVLPWIKRIK